MTFSEFQRIIRHMNTKLFKFSFLLALLISCSQIEIEPINSSENTQSPTESSQSNIEPKPVESNPIEIDKKEEKKEVVAKIPPKIEHTPAVAAYCKKVDKYFEKYSWGKSHCENFQWNHVRNSFWGNPIVWHVFGDEKRVKTAPEKTTMILCGVHGDEITPIKFCYDLLNDLKNKPEITGDNLVVIAPIVAPDSFFRSQPTRTNARGVDANRNFPTKDWDEKALKLWKHRYSSDKRRYPGKKAMSEQETYFQVNLINRYKPSKIISVHAPLTLIDYDGPDHTEHAGANQLLIQMSDKAGKYRINNYPFFPGSLGNWAGNERNIPTYTLELPNSDWTKTEKFYETFRTAIYHAIGQTLEQNSDQEKVSNSKESKLDDDKVL
ncbi:MAG: hypothetical protein CME65_06215 [Halobacteriovoraceae bacterium]|nr:hypothetical protein [Halobacteriovoraceae bacterium]